MTPLQEASVGTAVPGDAGSAVRAGYSLRKIRLLLLAGMSTWNTAPGLGGAHGHGEHPRAPHLPSSPGTARWPRPAPAAAPCPAAPRRGFCGEGGVGHTRGHPGPKHPQLPGALPAAGLPSGAAYLEGPRWEGASCSSGSRDTEDRMGPQQPEPPQPPPTSASGCGQSPRCSGG